MAFPDSSPQALLSSSEAVFRIAGFGLFFGLWALAERLAPRRGLIVPLRVRWVSNILVHLVNALLPRLLLPVLPFGLALIWEERGWGLLGALPLPGPVAVAAGFVALDFVIWGQHLIFHRVSFLWRLHRMHHTDIDLDLTTALRFHPLEILISHGVKLAAVALLGPPALAVLVFEILLNGSTLFNHGNFRIPPGLDGLLRRLVVTPDMHLVHHSTQREENNRNFGFNLSVWDRLFSTYLAEPSAGRQGMVIGLAAFQDPRYERFWTMLMNPLEKG